MHRDQLDAYGRKINLALFTDIITFIQDVVKASRAQRIALRQRCPFWPKENGGSIQEKYGFLYLGELLERYEERYGMDILDLRSIALALGYTSELLTDEMFVGNQRENFIRRLEERAEGDVYLTGALYLLRKGQDDNKDLEAKLTGMCASTEDLIFIVGLFDDPEYALAQFKPELVRFLGKDRSISVLGNTDILVWLITWVFPHIKGMKGKDAALLRALCALPVSHVKPESKYHTVLLEYGWLPLEIAYANIAVAAAQSVPGALNRNSIVMEKVVVTLFREALSQIDPLTPETYELLSDLYSRYKRFHIKCYGCESLDDTLDEVRIQNAQTFAWFAMRTDIYKNAFAAFDILESRWDALASDMKHGHYLALFENSLTTDMTTEDIRRRIDRYDKLTGRDYLALYQEKYGASKFSLMVNKGIIDLWEAFQSSLDDAGKPNCAAMLDNIQSYISGIKTKEAYTFFDKFFSRHSMADLHRFWRYGSTRPFESLVERRSHGYSSSDTEVRLNIDRDFLDDNGQRKLLGWLEEYFFAYTPDKYLNFVVGVLRDESVADLFTMDEQRALLQVAMGNPKVPHWVMAELKRRYLTEAELQAERDAEAAARLEAERQKDAELMQIIAGRYAESVNGTLTSVQEYLRKHRYNQKECQYACRVVHDHMDDILCAANYELSREDAARFLSICAILANNGAMGYGDAQSIISKVKECDEHGPDD